LLSRYGPLVNDWEMPKETAPGSSEGSLVYLKYTYRYKSQFVEPDDEWLEAVEATSDELLGAYSKTEDKGMNTAFGAHGKRRLNKVFDVIGFVYPDYCFPAHKQGTKRKITTITSSSTPKPKRTNVLTHWSKSYSLEKAVALPDTEKMEAVESAEATLSALEIIPAAAVETATAQLEKSKPESSRTAQQPNLQSPPAMVGLSKTTTVPAATPRKGRRMASVLDVVLKPSKITTPAPTNISEGKVDELKITSDEATLPDSTKVGPTEAKPLEQECESLPEKITSPIPEAASCGDFGYIIRHASGKQLSEQQIAEVQYYAKDLKYPRGSLVYGGNDEDDYFTAYRTIKR
jgi:hypothetical protein